MFPIKGDGRQKKRLKDEEEQGESPGAAEDTADLKETDQLQDDDLEDDSEAEKGKQCK